MNTALMYTLKTCGGFVSGLEHMMSIATARSRIVGHWMFVPCDGLSFANVSLCLYGVNACREDRYATYYLEFVVMFLLCWVAQ